MTNTLDGYRKRREKWLASVADDLARDERFAAAWLTGSYARKEEDGLSDIDISLVIADPYSGTLCQRHAGPMSQTSPERIALFSQFGEPALLHENNHNAPEGGTFTFVLYAGSAMMVDWTLIPHSNAMRPLQSRLLFSKVDLPMASVPAPETLEQSKKAVAETWAFFWMMAAITIKYILRGDGVFAAHWIEALHSMVREIERRLEGQSWRYTRGSLTSLQSTRKKQLQSVRELSNKMLALKDQVSKFTDTELLTPIAEIEALLTLAQQSNHHS